MFATFPQLLEEKNWKQKNLKTIPTHAKLSSLKVDSARALFPTQRSLPFPYISLTRGHTHRSTYTQTPVVVRRVLYMISGLTFTPGNPRGPPPPGPPTPPAPAFLARRRRARTLCTYALMSFWILIGLISPVRL